MALNPGVPRWLSLLFGLAASLPANATAQDTADSGAVLPQLSLVQGGSNSGDPDRRTLPLPDFRWIPRLDSLPCTQCDQPKRFWAGAAELMVVQLIPWSFSAVIKDAQWAKIGPDSWEENLENPWVWDNNAFKNNQFSHPYHGSLYFNAARSNGYNFWQSVPWAFAGSLMWELFFERWAPAPNDFINTSLGGITLGESLYRLSSLTLDNTSSGSERVFREIGGALLDPVRGFNRLIRGEMKGRSANPPDWRPSIILGALDVGYRHISGTSSLYGSGAVDQVVAEFLLTYGDVMQDFKKAPFSHFQLTAQLSSNNDVGAQNGALSVLQSRGSLAGWRLHEGAVNRTLIGTFLNYDYLENPAFEYGGQSLTGGLLSRWDRGRFRVQGELVARAIVLGATLSDYYNVQEGRNYDYGPGLGGTVAAVLTWRGRGLLRANYSGWQIYTMNGAPGTHYQDVFGVEGRVYLFSRYGAGVRYLTYHRFSDYENHPAVSVTSPQLTIFASLAVPRWE